jgi:outer membrane biogenesis lipoprotein LolB
MHNFIKIVLLTASCLLFVACSSEDNNQAVSEKGHVWKEQTDTINKAKEVEGIIMDSADQTRNALEQ